MPVALVTGASAGLGLALAQALAQRHWTLIIDARGAPALQTARRTLGPDTISIIGDVAEPAHRDALAAAVERAGRLDLLVNNASDLGPSPLPALAQYPPRDLERVYRVNVLAPLALIQLTLPLLTAAGGTIVNVSSDAAVEAYPGWGGYGSSKAALDQLTAVLAVELTAGLSAEPDAEGGGDRGGEPGAGRVRVYGFDPGDLRTDMHQRAFPGEDISDRPEPASVIPALLRLIDERPPGVRHRAADLLVPGTSGTDSSGTDSSGTGTSGTGTSGTGTSGTGTSGTELTAVTS